MIAFEDELRGASVETAILLTYAVGLGHFEREILPSLLATNDRSEILLLADHHQVEETFSEISAISGPGVHYRLHGIRLPAPQRAFHPKLYLTLGADEMSAWIGSANLTLFGCRVNAELVERLHFTPADRTHKAAWRDVADILDAIPALDAGLGHSVSQILRGAALEIRRRAETASESSLRVLHNAHHPLLEQVRSFVPPEDITRIHAVSPFFDPDGTALHALRDAYPGAVCNVITGPNAAGTLEGARVEEWEDPPALEIYGGLEQDSSRPLHAKLYLFAGPTGTWSLIGSPNLSDAAWALTARGRGNFECALLRIWPDPETASALLQPLDRMSGSWRDLVLRTADSTGVDEPGEGAALAVGTVERVGSRLRAHFSPGALTADDRVQLRLDLRSGILELPCSLERNEGGVWEATAALAPADSRLPEHPIIVTVRAVARDGAVREARVWLSQPPLLDRSNWQRRAAGLAAGYAGTMADDEALAFADLIYQVTAELAQAQAAHAAGGGGGQGDAGGVEEAAPGKTLGTEELVRPGEHRPGGDGLTGGSRRALDDVLRALAYWEPADEADPSEQDEEGAEDRPERGVRAAQSPAPYARSTIQSLRRSFDNSLNQWTRTRPSPANVGDLVRMLDARARGLLDVILRCLRTGDNLGVGTFTEALLKSLRLGFSIDGVEEASPAGWMIRAWVGDSTREHVRGAVEPVYSSLLVHLAAACLIARTRDIVVPGGVPLVFAGLQVTTDRSTVLERTDSDGSFTREIDRVARREVGFLSEAELVAALQAADGEIRATQLIRAARWWAPAFSDRYAALPDAPPQVSRLIQQLRNRRSGPLKGFVVRASGIHCGCGCRVPEQVRQEIERDSNVVKQCEMCRAHLLPFAIQHDTTRRVLRTFLSDLERSDG